MRLRARACTTGVLTCLGFCLAVAPTCAGTTVHEIEISAGVGYDSNAYLAPGDPYFDQNRQDTVNPRRESGFLLPTRISGDLEMSLGKGGRSFITEYQLDGDIYPDSTLNNANETFVKLQPGFRFHLGSPDRRKGFLDLRAFGAYKKDLYFDRDTGDESTSDGVDVSDRYTYTSVGAAMEFDYDVSRAFGLFLDGLGEVRDYEDPGVVESFDHDRVRAKAGFVVRLSEKARGYVHYQYDAREYSDRHARSLDGERPDTNPLLEYVYKTFTTQLRLKPVRPWTLEFRWSLKNRTDGHLDYNEYDQETYRIRSTVNGKRVRWQLTAKYWEREFDRAFIFDDPVHPTTGASNPFKDYETLKLEFEGYLKWKKHVRPFVRVEYDDQESEDPRYAYERTQAMAGFELTY